MRNPFHRHRWVLRGTTEVTRVLNGSFYATNAFVVCYCGKRAVIEHEGMSDRAVRFLYGKDNPL